VYSHSKVPLLLPPNGLFDECVVKESELPVYSFLDDPESYMPSDLWTFTDLKQVLKITLTIEERQSMVVAFQISSPKQQGYSPLYSFTQIINKRYDANVLFTPQIDE